MGAMFPNCAPIYQLEPSLTNLGESGEEKDEDAECYETVRKVVICPLVGFKPGSDYSSRLKMHIWRMKVGSMPIWIARRQR